MKKEFESLDDLKEWLNEQINDCWDYIIDEAATDDPELDQVRSYAKDQLPKLINVQSDAAQALLQTRLEGKKYPSSLEPFLEVLYNKEYDYTGYKGLGENDGAAQLLATIADKLGMTEESKRAYAAVYSCD